MADAAEAPGSDRYNILVLTTDQTSAHVPSAPGYELPNRRRLERDGVSFTDFQVNSALCTPSRSVMFTGVHATRTGMWDNTSMAWIDDLDPNAHPTIGHMLRHAGYYTAYKGKWHLSTIAPGDSHDALEPFGFSDYQTFGEILGGAHHGHERDGAIAADAAAWLTGDAPRIGRSQPWFLAVNLTNPHDIMFFDADGTGETQRSGLVEIAPEPDDPLYRRSWDVELPDSFDDPLEQHPEAVRYYRRLCDLTYGEMPLERREMWVRYLTYYLNCLRDVDRHLGTILDALDASGQAERTIVVYTSDHGDMLAAHGMRQKGAVPFKEQWGVPFIVVHPDQHGGRTTDALGTTLDIVPTLLGWAGLDDEARSSRYPGLHGIDLGPIVADPATASPRGSSREPGTGVLYTYDVLWAVDVEFVAEVAAAMGTAADDIQAAPEKSGPLERAKRIVGAIRAAHLDARHAMRGVYDGRYKLVRFFAIDGHNRPAGLDDLYRDNDVALYDLRSDPDELVDLADRGRPDYDPGLVGTLNAKLEALIAAELGEDPDLVERPVLFMGLAAFKRRRGH